MASSQDEGHARVVGEMKRVDSDNGKFKWKALSSRVLGESERKPTKVGLKLAERFGNRYAYAIILIGTLTKALSACGQTTFLGGVLDYIEADLGMKRSTTRYVCVCVCMHVHMHYSSSHQ